MFLDSSMFTNNNKRKIDQVSGGNGNAANNSGSAKKLSLLSNDIKNNKSNDVLKEENVMMNVSMGEGLKKNVKDDGLKKADDGGNSSGEMTKGMKKNGDVGGLEVDAVKKRSEGSADSHALKGGLKANVDGY